MKVASLGIVTKWLTDRQSLEQTIQRLVQLYPLKTGKYHYHTIHYHRYKKIELRWWSDINSRTA